MSDKERDGERHDSGQTEEPVQDPSTDDFEAHRHIERDDPGRDGGELRRDDPGRDDPGRDTD